MAQAQRKKEDDVKIVSFMPVALPNPMGGLGLTIWGLGSDDKMYMWDSKQEAWLIGG